jgi:hypothetical protein
VTDLAVPARPTGGRPPRTVAVRRYAPLLALVAAVVLTIVALPSALNLPQANPGQTLEYAPVPPNSKAPPPPGGNFAALGQGTSGGEGAGGLPTPTPTPAATAVLPPPPSGPPGSGTTPSGKRCVGNPPRQTEDPFAPPCVAYFNGNNGGATYQGVTATEIRVLLVYDGNHNYYLSSGKQTSPSNTYVDLWQPAPSSGNEFFITTDWRGFQAYFNDRYQLYGRKAHFFIYYTHDIAQNETADMVRGEALDNQQTVHPFGSVVVMPAFGEDYNRTLAQQGVLDFTANLATQSFYQSFPDHIWGFLPGADYWATLYSSFVCAQVNGGAASHAGGALAAQPRKYGFIESTDAQHPELSALFSAVKSNLASCGINPVDTAQFPVAGAVRPDTSNYSAPQMARFSSEGITTILWPGGFETNFTKAASGLHYQPEWVAAGDTLMEGQDGSLFQDQSEWAHAMVVSPLIAEPPFTSSACWQAYAEVDPNADVNKVSWVCPDYPRMRQLFTGIQVAGPHLTPSSIADGFHAIPPLASNDPQAPSCYYPSNDWTCIKDAVALWWNSTTSGGGPCYEVADGNKRYRPSDWAKGAGDWTQDACDNYNPGVLLSQ